MSDVRLSNASPTLERVDARQPDNVRPSVRRSLFGAPDREELGRYLTATLQESVQDFTERYNFDPVDERPLTPRNYEWEEANTAPEFYRRPPHGNQRPERGVDASGDLRGDEESSEGDADTSQSRKRRSGDFFCDLLQLARVCFHVRWTSVPQRRDAACVRGSTAGWKTQRRK